MKRILAIVLTAAALAIALSACSKNEEETQMKELFDTVCTADEALERAKKENVVVFEGLKCTAGGDVWDAFYRTVSREKPASVLCAYYYTLDPAHVSAELYEKEKDQYPKLFFSLVEYNGETYRATTRDCTEKKVDYQETFRYLLHFTGQAPGQAVYSSYDNYVLVDDPSATWEGIMEGLYSSRANAGYKHCTVYQNTLD